MYLKKIHYEKAIYRFLGEEMYNFMFLTSKREYLRRFPTAVIVRDEWFHNKKMFNKQSLTVGDSTRICGKHFDENKRPVYFPLMTSPNSTYVLSMFHRKECLFNRCSSKLCEMFRQELEYLTDCADENDENVNTINLRCGATIGSETIKKKSIRYPGDIKSTNNLSNDSLRVAVGVMQHTIKYKDEKIREISEVNRKLIIK